MRRFLAELAVLVIAALVCWIAWLMLSPVPALVDTTNH